MKIYIPEIDFSNIKKKQLFLLTRPFLDEFGWGNNQIVKEEWRLKDNFEFTSQPNEANMLLIGMPINEIVKKNKVFQLIEYNQLCVKYNIKGYGYISDDFGIAYPEFSNLTYFRMGGFKSQLSTKNLGFPVPLSDHFKRIYQLENPIPNNKAEKPIVGFCGHATNSPVKRVKELIKCLKENSRRVFENPFRKDWEPLFSSAYERWSLLQFLEKSQKITCNFIYRTQYRGGAQNLEQRESTTKEYYDNIALSDYVLCVRGAGNFSVRFYETLLMGKIPILVNTDCLLPLEHEIDWKKHTVWVEWNDRNQIAERVLAFHEKLSNEQFILLQKSNRQLWKEKLTVAHFLEIFSHAV